MKPQSWGIPLTWAVVPLAIVAVACIYRPFFVPDETRYAAVAWSMWEGGDWLVPHLNGLPYSHKPPLLFWLVDAGWYVLGVNDWWPRVMTASFGIASQFLTWRLARRLWPERPDVAWLASCILLGSAWWAIFLGLLMFDLVLTFFVLLALDAVLGAAAGERRGWPLYAVGIGLGVLCKGPVMLLYVLPAALLAPWWRDMGGVWLSWYARMIAAVLAGAAIALAWALAAASAGGEQYAHAILWGQTAGRVANSFAHARPWWWYLPLLPLVFLPWSICPAVWRGLGRFSWRRLDAGDRFLVSWLVPAFVALCLVSGKQVHYLLPIFPAIALLLGRVIDQSRISLSYRDVLPWVVAMTLVGIGWLALPYLPHGSIKGAAPLAELSPLWSLLPFAIAALCLLVPRKRVTQSVACAAVLFPLFYAGLHVVLASNLLAMQDVRPISLRVSALQSSGIEVANVGEYRGEYDYYGRLEHPLAVIDPGSLDRWLSKNCRAWLVEHLKTARPPAELQDGYWQRFRGGSLMLVPASRYPGRKSACGVPAAVPLLSKPGLHDVDPLVRADR